MTKSPEDILKGLCLCAKYDQTSCRECAYREEPRCWLVLCNDLLELFKELTDENARLKSENMVIQMNLDAAINEIECLQSGREKLDSAVEDIFLHGGDKYGS